MSKFNRYLPAVIETIIPATANQSPSVIVNIIETIQQKLSSQPSALQKQLKLFIGFIHYFPLLWTGKTFERLTPEKRLAFLERLQYAPIQKVRIGFWGLRTLIYMGYYGNPEVQAQIGYNPQIRGWEALRETATR